MEALKKTLFILSIIAVTSYTIRHIYLKWVEPRGSVLDKYEEPIVSEIKKATSLQQLEKLYADANSKVSAYEAIDSIKAMEAYKRMELEPYKNRDEARDAISAWERQSQEIFKIRFYWALGLVLGIIGFLVYKKVNPWLGISVLITGFAEMVYWTSPSFFYGAEFEYNNLLTNKIILSIATLVLLILGGFLTDTLKSSTK
jgi:hypothetical protein